MSDDRRQGESEAERERRLAFNEALARDVNELVEEVAHGWFDADELVEFRCECVDPGCSERLRLTRAEYASVRASALTFVVVAGHVDPEIEELAGNIRDYQLLRKTGHGRDVAEATDPRAGR